MLLDLFGAGQVLGERRDDPSRVYAKSPHALRLVSSVYFVGEVGISKLRLAVGCRRVILRVFEVEVVEIDLAIAVGGR